MPEPTPKSKRVAGIALCVLGIATVTSAVMSGSHAFASGTSGVVAISVIGLLIAGLGIRLTKL